MKKTLIALAISALSVSGTAFASPFYVETDTNFNGATTATSDKVCDTCTALKDEITYIYQSISTTLDTDGSGDLSAGDTIFTNGGLNVFPGGTIIKNQVTGFNPSESFGVSNDNGYGGSNWLLSFSFTGLIGTITEYVPNTTLELAYGPSGSFDLFYSDDGVNFYNFMDIEITGAVTTSGGTLLSGLVNFADVDVLNDIGTDPGGLNDWMVDLFHSGTATCGGSDSFFDIWTNCDGTGLDLMEIQFLADFNTNAATIDITDNGAQGAILIGDHDGSAVFNIPEPSTLALLGGSLLLLGAGARRKKA